MKSFKYLGSLVKNENSTRDEIKCRLKAGNSCYYSVQALLSSRLLPRNLKIKIYKTIILSVVLYGCKTWSLTLKEERRLRVFENRILKWIFEPKKDANEEWRRLNNEEFHSLYCSPNIFSVLKSRRLRRTAYVSRIVEGRITIKILTWNVQERELHDGLGGDGRTILRVEWILKKWVSIRGIRLIRPRIGIIGEHLWMRHWTSVFHKPWS